MCCRAVRLWRGFAGRGRLPQHPLWCGEFRLRINAGFRPPCSLRERQSRKRGLLSAGALCRGGRTGRFYHDTKRRSHPPAVRYYHFIAALFSITAEKCKDFFCLFPDFRKVGIWGWTGAGRRKAQGKSPGERDERRAGAGKGACGRVGLCCGETCGTESRAGTEVRRGKAISEREKMANCSGSIRFVYYAKAYVHALDIQYQPSFDEKAEDWRAFPYTEWAVQSYYNFRKFNSVLNYGIGYRKAVDMLQEHYAGVFGVSSERALNAALNVLNPPSSEYFKRIAPDNVNYLLLTGAPWAEIEKRLPDDVSPMKLLDLSIAYPENLRRLIALGQQRQQTDVDETNDFGKTPLQTAAQYGYLESVRILLAAGADINHRTDDGNCVHDTDDDCIRNGKRTALMYALQEGQYEVAKYLLDNGADISLLDSQAKSAFDYLIGRAPKLSTQNRMTIVGGTASSRDFDEEVSRFTPEQEEELKKRLFVQSHRQLADMLAGEWEPDWQGTGDVFKGKMTIRANADAGKPLLQMEDERGTTADCVSLAASRAIFKCMVKPAENGDVPVADGGIAVYTAFEVQRNFINVFTVYGVREKDTVDAARAEKDLENRCLDVGSLCWRGFTAHYERIERRQSAAGEA